MISKITASIKNYPLGALIVGAGFFLGTKMILKRGIALSALAGVAGAILGSGIQAKYFGKSGSNKITVTGAPVETGTTSGNKNKTL